jgi:hypothetical protein
MLPLLGAVKALVSMARLPKKIVESIEAPSPEMQEKVERTLRQALVETMTVSTIVCRGLLAERMGVEPTSEQLRDFMSKMADDPRFAHRAYRLFGEAQKSSDRRRRVFLASVLYGLADSKMPEDDRDRVDMAVERMTVPDVQFLAVIEAKRANPDFQEREGMAYLFGTDGLGAVITGTSLRIATPNEWTTGSNSGLVEGFFEDPRFEGDRAALASLVSVGCLDIGDAVVTVGDRGKIYHLRMLPLANLVLQALHEVRPGFAGGNE